ncbi:MAG: 2Fe-2S iron-sulfur cluster-binding protein [Bdellovibrionota bacterium]
MSKEFYSLTFLPEGKTLEVEIKNPPSSATGQEGSILSIALASGVDIDHACGGVTACSTCHIYVKEGLETCNPTSEAEDDQLDKAPGLTPRSRLACQCIPNGTRPVVIEIPKWNRNLVREGN